MHRFQPRIYLVVRPEGVNHPITDIEQERYRTYIFPETIFTAVTAYQNQLVSLKHKLLVLNACTKIQTKVYFREAALFASKDKINAGFFLKFFLT